MVSEMISLSHLRTGTSRCPGWSCAVERRGTRVACVEAELAVLLLPAFRCRRGSQRNVPCILYWTLGPPAPSGRAHGAHGP